MFSFLPGRHLLWDVILGSGTVRRKYSDATTRPPWKRPSRPTFSRREWLALASVSAVCIPSKLAAAQSTATGYVTPEQFGAAGDGVTNDTAAFAKMAAYINHHGGGTISLRATTYVVGSQSYQRSNPDYSFTPSPIMEFSGCSKSLSILGNGARIRCADGLRFGTFDRAGQPTSHALPYYGTGELACPYFSMIHVANCSGAVQISDIELDGNVAGLQIGGPWGDSGWQIGCAGLRLDDNTGAVIISNVNSHHHAQDGGSGNGPGLPGSPEYVSIENCKFASNGRNAWSMVGGVGWKFSQCSFDGSARDLPFAGSAPKAGIDFEAEGGKYVQNIHLVDCNASDNAWSACTHPGDSHVSDVLWEGGRLVGTIGWSYYGGGNEGIAFKGVTFLGALVNLTKESFADCTFSNDISQSPTGVLFNPNGWIIPDCVAGNTFAQCAFIHSKPEWSGNGNFDQALFEDCVFQSVSGAGRLDVYGHFRGSSTRFTAANGGTNFAVTPDALGGSKSAGGADDPFSITTSDGSTTTYTPTPA
ncbi:MAG TPA: hypothetical protein VN713_01995 [Sphingomicrobium sp.]|nr:hypothetical protein [Sphingomicrobium sp.]